MVSAPLSSTWDLLGSTSNSTSSTFYRKVELYSLYPSSISSINLSDHIVVAAKHAGPIAMMRDPSKPILITSNTPITHSKHKINIYSAAGIHLQSIQWDAPTKIIQLGWTSHEQLVILTQDGTYRLYPLQPLPSSPSSSSPTTDQSYTQHSIFSLSNNDSEGLNVLQAKIYQEGMVILTNQFQFIEIKNWSTKGSGKVVELARVELDRVPNCWCVVPGSVSSSRGTEVLISTDKTILRLDEIEVVDQGLTRGPFKSIIPSPSGRFLALLSSPSPSSSQSQQLWVTSLDFSRSLSEFDITSSLSPSSPISKLEWCGSNSVVLALEEEGSSQVVMVGPFGETLKYFYAGEGGVELVGEMDGVRILSQDSHDLLQIVPQSSQSIFLPGSTSPSAILFEASQLFNQRSPKADEFIRSIRGELGAAVDGCIDAAGREWDIEWQKKLLQAAAFGKSFLEVYNPNEFVQTTKHVRILNAVRDYKIGLPLTIDQLNARPLAHLISRLNSRNQHLLSLRISTYLNLNPSPVIRHWAQQLILSSSPSSAQTSFGPPKTDEEICSQIVDKLQSTHLTPTPATSGVPQVTVTVGGGGIGLSSADIALTAFNLGRTRLAGMLVEKEFRLEKKVGMLGRMGETEDALKVAENSGDPDLIYSVLLPLISTRAPGDVFKLLLGPPANFPISTSLLTNYAKELDLKLLRDFYFVDDRRWEMALLELKEGLDLVEKGGDAFGERVEKVRRAGKKFGEDKEFGFEAKISDEHVKLLILQQTLESESPNKRSYVGLSVNETIRSCILDGLEKKVDKIKKDFSIPDKRFWYIKLKSLIQIRDWDALETFSRLKKSPIGYEPWVEALISAGAHRQAVKYVERCEGRNKVELFVKAGEWVMGGEEAVRRGERGKLLDLKSRAPNSIIAAQIDELIRSMESAGM